ncbi:MAG: VOC family protein [Luteolibacter sp.]
MHLGHLDICLSVKNITQSFKFYKGLGFELVDGNPNGGYAILAKDETRIGLYNHKEPLMLNFRGANLNDVAAYLRSKGMESVPEVEVESDGSTGFTVTDPDGNLIYFNTAEGHDPDPN